MAIVFFAISIGARINFALFILVTIFFYENFKKSFIDKISISISVIFSGCLFYLPIWFQSRLKLTWLTAARPIEQDFYGLIARFFYKSWQAFGVFASLLIIYFLIKNLKNIKNIKNINLCFGIITSNLLIFLYIPSELSYLQPAIIVTMYLLSQVLSKIKIYIIIFFSLFQWLTEIGFVKIKYASKDICGEVHAIGAQFQFKVFEGRYFQFQNTRGKIKCWLHDTDSLRSKNIIQGKKTRVH